MANNKDTNRAPASNDAGPASTKTKASADAPDIIVLDYRGNVGSSKGQKAVDHVRSPLIVPVTIHGKAAMVLHPGINVIDRADWDELKSIRDKNGKPTGEVRQLSALVTSGQLIEVKTQPADQFTLGSMIDRTICESGFQWIESCLDVLAEHGLEVDSLRNALEQRKTKTTQVNVVETEYQSNADVG